MLHICEMRFRKKSFPNATERREATIVSQKHGLYYAFPMKFRLLDIFSGCTVLEGRLCEEFKIEERFLLY